MENNNVVVATPAVTIASLLSAAALAKFEVAYKWNTRKFASIGKRPSFEKWLESYINGKAATAACEYAEAQAEASMKSLAVKFAEETDCTIAEAYEALGLRLRSEDTEATQK